MRSLQRILFISLSLVLLTAAASSAMDLGGHDRDGVVFGFNIGAGWNKMDYAFPDDDGLLIGGETNTEVDLTGNLTLGWARNDNLVLSIGAHGWKARYWVRGNSLSASTTQFQIDLAWFPRGNGFWLRGGVGPGNISFSAVVPAANVTFQEWGWAWLGGAGYEFRVSNEVAIGFAYEYRYLSVGAFEDFDDTSMDSHCALLSFRWYQQ